MIDFASVRKNELPFDDLVAGLTCDDLRSLTGEMVDEIQTLIINCRDEDVVFEPQDEQAHDPWAERAEEVDMPWTLGHVIVHITASAEESASLAAEMARGVELHGRSRYEVPWREMVTITGCRMRLEESRRMCLASLDMWPDAPHIEYMADTWKGGPRVNAAGRYILGLLHAIDHLEQIRDIINQSKTA